MSNDVRRGYDMERGASYFRQDQTMLGCLMLFLIAFLFCVLACGGLLAMVALSRMGF